MGTYKKALLIMALSASLSACGGGGGAGTTLSFPLQTAVVNLYSTGYQKTAVVSGTALISGLSIPVSGAVTLTRTPAANPTTFEGQDALVATTSVAGSITVGSQTLSMDSSTQGYLSPTYAPLGYAGNGQYCVATTASSYPSTVTIGQTGPIVSYNCYTDSTKTTPTGSESLSFAVAPGPSNSTATVSLIDTFVDFSNVQLFRAQDNYVVDTAGNYTFVSESGEQTLTANGTSITVNLTITPQ
ncbi:MAG: hypothetical protein HIU89_04995 [Proteobacteria bacterium]|nr:hypothetical protein [Pseudomonadota bacterium]